MRELKILKKTKDVVEEKARRRAKTLLRQSRDRAIEILGEVNVDAVKWQEVMESELEKLTSDEIGKYKEDIQNVSKHITSQLDSEVQNFSRVLEMETVGIEKSVADRMQQSLLQADKEVEVYRNSKFKQVEENIVETMEEVTRQVLHKQLSFNDQAELAIQALEKAKEKHVFG
jgi:hypothetical protein